MIEPYNIRKGFSTNKMKRILAIQNCWDDPPGQLGEILQEYAIACDVIKAEEEPIPDPTTYDAFIILGGPQHASDDEQHPYLAEEKRLLRQAVERDTPFLGVCLGGQLLAHALGAPVTRHHMTEIGFFEVQFTDAGKHDPLFKGLPGHQLVFQWHMDTFALPAGAMHLATSENTDNQAFRFGRRAYGLQYHIEVSQQMLTTWIQYPEYREEIKSILGPDAPDILEQQHREYALTYQKHTRLMFENFLHIAGLA